MFRCGLSLDGDKSDLPMAVIDKAEILHYTRQFSLLFTNKCNRIKK